MTKAEFEAWKAETERSTYAWRMDMLRYHNGKSLFFYIGGNTGRFVQISADGHALIGHYSGAIPHIGDALFYIDHERQFPDQHSALVALSNRLGPKFATDAKLAIGPERMDDILTGSMIRSSAQAVEEIGEDELERSQQERKNENGQN
jgi:hypothetical protein